MQFRSFAFAAILSALTASAQPAQPTCNGQICTFPLSFDDAADYLAGITGAAFSGQEQDANSSTLPNGTRLSHENLRNMTYRDFKGRVRTERHAYFAPPPGQPVNPNDFVIAEIHDPVAGFVYVLDPVSKVAHRMALPQTSIRKWDPSNIAKMQGPSGPNTVVAFLGAQTISGVNANGYRSTWTRTGPAGDRFVRTTEDWYALATGVRLLDKQTSGGNENISTITETNYSEAQPEPSLFQIPDGYKTVDETGPFQVVHPQTGGGRSGGGIGLQLTSTCEEGVCAVTFNPGNASTGGAVTGAPYSGHEIVTSVVNDKPFVGRPNGIGQYRDSSGRQRTDPASAGVRSIQVGETEPSLVRIEDPVAGYVYIVSPATQTAYRIKANFRSFAFEARSMQPAGTHTMLSGATDTIEDLPPQTITGIAAAGQRDTTTYPPGTYNGNDKTVVAVNERWIDPQTGVALQTSNTGLRANIITSMPDYKEGDPDAALFQIPAGYKIIDESGKFTFDVPAGTK